MAFFLILISVITLRLCTVLMDGDEIGYLGLRSKRLIDAGVCQLVSAKLPLYLWQLIQGRCVSLSAATQAAIRLKLDIRNPCAKLFANTKAKRNSVTKVWLTKLFLSCDQWLMQ